MERGTPSTDAKQGSKHSYLQSQLLIAMPGLGDPYFDHSVTLICQHNQDGCFGLTINRPIEVTLEELFEQLDIPSEKKSIKGMRALRGGPVQVEQGFVIHDKGKVWENTLTINDEISVTASRDILFDIAKGEGPENFLLTLGCASWGPGQMESEIMNNSWLNCDVDKKILFNTPFKKRWRGAVDTLGIDVNFISDIAGHD
jgi:putative transcriptional regulator